MTRQTSIQLTEATERQAKSLTAQGFGSFTDVVRLAIDRMYREEAGMDKRRMSEAELRGEAAWAQAGDASIAESVESYGGDVRRMAEEATRMLCDGDADFHIDPEDIVAYIEYELEQ